MNERQNNNLILAGNLDDAINSLKDSDGKAILVAGATWIMRAPVRREKMDITFVCLSRVKELKDIAITDHQLSIGSMVTHEQLSTALEGVNDLQGLRQAARKSANPAIRNSATIGGNICTPSFPASDLAPALLSLNASVEIVSPGQTKSLPVGEFLSNGGRRTNSEIMSRIVIPRSPGLSAHERLTMRKAGEYSVANLSVSVCLSRGGKIRSASIAVGSVESKAKRWKSLECALVGTVLSSDPITEVARNCTDEFTGRDAVDAPGWYRVSVLPGLAGKVMENLKDQSSGARHHDH